MKFAHTVLLQIVKDFSAESEQYIRMEKNH